MLIEVQEMRQNTGNWRRNIKDRKILIETSNIIRVFGQFYEQELEGYAIQMIGDTYQDLTYVDIESFNKLKDAR